jgi:tRNA-dihydrouridine synthase A
VDPKPPSVDDKRTPDPAAWRFCVAPMMACTDRHYRHFARLLSQHARLYTEMVVAQAVLHGPRERLLAFGEVEHPVALQLGGSDPGVLAAAARIGAAAGYDEINLNVGCPSDRVQAGRFGACLMKEPALVADCVAAMRDAVSIPVTVKTRLGVDDLDSYDALAGLIARIRDAGCRVVLLHARKALLNLDTRANRQIPPLDYPRVHRIKADFPELCIVLNGGLGSLDECLAHLPALDGVMLGRAAYDRPLLLQEVDARLFGQPAQSPRSALALLAAFMPYLEAEYTRGTPLRVMTKHLCGLFHGRPGARDWRRLLSGEAGAWLTPAELRATITSRQHAESLTA